MTVAEKNRVIKKALLKNPRFKKVSVTTDRGTAYGWVKVLVIIDEALNHDQKCEINQQVRDIATKALADVGEKFYTYTSDDGWGESRDCLSVRISGTM